MTTPTGSLPVTGWFGANAIDDTVANIITALGSKSGSARGLFILWTDVASSLNNGSTSTPDSGEDWLAAIGYNALNVTANTANNTRKVYVAAGAPSIDNGYYITGSTFLVRNLSFNFYSPFSETATPSPSDF